MPSVRHFSYHLTCHCRCATPSRETSALHSVNELWSCLASTPAVKLLLQVRAGMIMHVRARAVGGDARQIPTEGYT